MEKRFPMLKTKYLELPDGSASISVDFPKNYLIVGFICPEISDSADKLFNNLNLLPYELAVSRFFQSDYQYDLSVVNQIGTREIKNLDVIRNATLNTTGTYPLIISYIEFNII